MKLVVPVTITPNAAVYAQPVIIDVDGSNTPEEPSEEFHVGMHFTELYTS